MRLLPSYSPTLSSKLSALSTRLSGQGEKVPCQDHLDDRTAGPPAWDLSIQFPSSSQISPICARTSRRDGTGKPIERTGHAPRDGPRTLTRTGEKSTQGERTGFAATGDATCSCPRSGKNWNRKETSHGHCNQESTDPHSQGSRSGYRGRQGIQDVVTGDVAAQACFTG